MSTLINYIKDTRGELSRVSWPSRKQAIGFTLTVILVSVFIAFFLGFFDYIFSLIIQKFIIV
jgi:preprotein translocase subunit SecE